MRHLLRPLTLICWLLCGLGCAWAGGGGVSALMAANPHQGFDTGSTNPSHRYGFQGEACPERSRRESDDELYGDGNAIAFTYRVHACPERSRRDPRIGRFLSVDPLAPEYPWNSPYAFSENKVIQFIELEGLEIAPNNYNFTEEEYNSPFYDPRLKVAHAQFLLNEMEKNNINLFYVPPSDEGITPCAQYHGDGTVYVWDIFLAICIIMVFP